MLYWPIAAVAVRTPLVVKRIWREPDETEWQARTWQTVCRSVDAYKGIHIIEIKRFVSHRRQYSIIKNVITSGTFRPDCVEFPENGASMEESYTKKIAEITANEKCSGYALLRSAEVKMAKSGKPYLDATLSDVSGEVFAKMWDWPADQTPPSVGNVVKFSGMGNEFNGRMQLKLETIETAQEGEYDIALLLPHAPEDPKKMLAEVLKTAAGIKNRSIRDIVCELLRRVNEGGRLLTFPAARSLHHAEIGGLLHHITTMLRMANAVCDVYTTLDRDLLCAGVILHDLGKLYEMEVDGATGLVSGYTTEGRLIGHLSIGAAKIALAAQSVGASKEAEMELCHMVLSHHGRVEFGSQVPPRFPEAEVLSKIDELDARIYEMENALRNVEPGAFSERVWALDNRELYKVPDLEKFEG